jgi:hypothetical protein
MTDQARTDPAANALLRPARSTASPLRWIELGSTAVAFTVLVQAALAGQIVTGRHWLVTSHRIVAEALPVLAVALVVVGWMGRAVGRTASMSWALVLGVALIVAQTGLGFVGRSSQTAIAIHVPLGVAILGIYVGVATAARVMRAGLTPVARNTNSPASARRQSRRP